MSQTHRTQNAALTAENTSNAADRNFTVQEKIRELQRDDPSLSYDAAWEKVKTLPEMQRTFNAMTKPAEIQDPAKVQEIPAAQRKASSKFRGLVQTAAAQRGISRDQAWQQMQEEEADLFAAMSGPDPIKEGYDKINRPDLA
jgi:transcriptional regulator with AAA-type ATPase domain